MPFLCARCGTIQVIPEEQKRKRKMANNLVIYYSRKGQNYVDGKLVDLEVGNTELIAQYIRDAVGADLFEIETVKDYPADYMECTEVAKQEQRDNARPKLKEYLHDISEYDNIVIAGPCWWGTYPCAVFGQLEKLHFKGKHVWPVMTHEGSGEAKSRSDLKKFCTGAKVGKTLAIQGSKCPAARDAVTRWAEKHLT